MNQIKLDHNDGKTCFDLDQKALVGRLHQHQMSVRKIMFILFKLFFK